MGNDSMTLTERLKKWVTGSKDPEMYQYQCNVCQATFDSPEADIQAAACDACGASNVRALE